MTTNVNKEFEYNSEYFERISGTWTKLSYPFISKNLINHLDLKKNKVDNSLDIGCGYGVYSGILLKYTDKVYGLDISHEACNVCKQLGYSEVYNTNVDSIPIEDGKMDFVFTTEVLEHILDYEKMLSEIYRVLNKDGSLVLTTTCYSTSIFQAVENPDFKFLNYLDYLAGYFNNNFRESFIRKFCFHSLGGHYHGFLPNKLVTKMQEIGFSIEKRKLFTVHQLVFYKDGIQMLRKSFSKSTPWSFHKRLLAIPAAICFILINFIINNSYIFQNNILIVAKKSH